MNDRVEIRRLGPGDREAVLEASALFDRPAEPSLADRFLDAGGHVLFIASVDDAPVGFVSGVEMTHPDKGTEMFLYELGVAEPFRRQGIATALVAALRELARERGCYGMWVAVDAENTGAHAFYMSFGPPEPGEQVVHYTWHLGEPDSADP